MEFYDGVKKDKESYTKIQIGANWIGDQKVSGICGFPNLRPEH